MTKHSTNLHNAIIINSGDFAVICDIASVECQHTGGNVWLDVYTLVDGSLVVVGYDWYGYFESMSDLDAGIGITINY